MANTVHDALNQAIGRLAITAQAATARRDAELLLLHVTGLTHAALLTHPEQPLTLAQLEAYFQAVERRAQSEPIQYITGEQEFYGLAFHVTPAVLIPRPETEHLVEKAIDIAASCSGPIRVLDIGTGSGIIAVALACHLPNATITATDISEAALAVARSNAKQHAVADRITFAMCDLFPPNTQPFDIICSNPPYVSNNEVLATQVAAYEPHAALFAGPTGLEIYRRLIPAAAKALKSGGSLLLEIGHGQSPAIELLFRESDLQNVQFIPDLQGIPRIALAQNCHPDRSVA
jgi:release factor glutamine methyltransferase